MRGDDLLDGHEPLAVGEDHEPAEQRRHLDAGDPLIVTGRVRHHHHQVEREAGDVREGMGGIHRERGEHREDALVEDLVQVGTVLLVQARPVAEADALPVQLRHQAAQEGAGLAGVDVDHLGADRPHLSLGPVGVGGGPLEPGRELLEAPHPDLEELVQRAAGDGEEARPLQQGEVLVLGLGEHPPVEVEPGELAVDQRRLVGWPGGTFHRAGRGAAGGRGVGGVRGARPGDVDGGRRLGLDSGCRFPPPGGRRGRSRRGGGLGCRAGCRLGRLPDAHVRGSAQPGGRLASGGFGGRGGGAAEDDVQGGLGWLPPIGARQPGSRGRRASSPRSFNWHLTHCASARTATVAGHSRHNEVVTSLPVAAAPPPS